MNHQKRVAAIHDLSGVGKCSLTVALPILSAAGVECACLPTAVLSTHTGGLKGYTCRDLTEDLLPMANHWKSLGLAFDAIYTGYLGSFRQLELVQEIIRLFRTPETFVLVDPVMADNGSLYASFDSAFPAGMRTLCQQADVVVPNITEACLLAGLPYQPAPYSPAFIEELLSRLRQSGMRDLVLTGVSFDPEVLGVACFQAGSMQPEYFFSPTIPGTYHGTGDVFASTLLGGVLRGIPLAKAARTAMNFTTGCIQRTRTAATDPRYGVNFEAGLPGLIQIWETIRERT